MSKLRIAVAGCGMIAEEVYLPAIARNPRAELVAACERSPERVAYMAERFAIPRVYDDFERMLGEAEIDLLFNLTHIQGHYPVNRAALRAGVHLFSEKPIAAIVEQADELVETARSRRLKFGAGIVAMLAPVNQQVKALLARGAIGKVAFARVTSSNGGPAYEPSWPADPTWFYQVGAGPLFDMGVYGLHAITGILGPAKRVTAFSGLSDPVRVVRGGPYAGKRIDVETDDVTLLLLDFGDATFATLDATYCVRATRAPSLNSMEIYGADGTIAASIWEGQPPLAVWRDDQALGLRGWTAVEGDTRPLDLGSAVDHMVDCVLDDRPVIPSGEHARHVLEIMVKAMLAARTGQAQDIQTVF